MEVPPPFVNLKVSRGQRGGAIPGRRSLEGVGGVLGSWGKFLVSFSLLFKKSAFIHLRARDWRACPVPMYQFLAELNGRRCLKKSESFIFKIVLLVVIIVSA